ncbi:MAG: hypothetical protein E7581_03515 [Ruminococcaceae bacterium]|nr:hypothetical protein [Oscillospiraceae bacterium]
MTNTTAYTHDLILKMKRNYSKKSRRMAWFMFIFTGGLSLYGIIYDLVFEHAHTMSVGMFFFALMLFWLMILIRGGKRSLSKAVSKEMEGNPDTVIEFQFDQDCLRTKQTSKYSTGGACHSYEFFAKAEKMDDNSFYLLTKQNQFYVLHDPNGIGELYDFVCGKINKSSSATK